MSNSSSSSYIVLVKPGYIPILKEIEDINPEIEDDDLATEDGKPNEAYLEKVKVITEELRDGNVIYEYDDDWCVAENVVMELPGVLDIGSADVGGGSGSVAGLSSCELKELREFLDA